LAGGETVLIHGHRVESGACCSDSLIGRGTCDRHGVQRENRDFLLSLGADEVIDYQQVRFEDAVHDVDIVLDTIGAGNA